MFMLIACENDAFIFALGSYYCLTDYCKSTLTFPTLCLNINSEENEDILMEFVNSYGIPCQVWQNNSQKCNSDTHTFKIEEKILILFGVFMIMYFIALAR